MKHQSVTVWRMHRLLTMARFHTQRQGVGILICCFCGQLLTQICVALSALVLRSVEARKPVEQLFASLNELQGQGTGSNAVLELLTVLPEEVLEDQSLLFGVDSVRTSQFSLEVRTPELLLRYLPENRSSTKNLIDLQS